MAASTSRNVHRDPVRRVTSPYPFDGPPRSRRRFAVVVIDGAEHRSGEELIKKNIDRSIARAAQFAPGGGAVRCGEQGGLENEGVGHVGT